jgi:hypothetical protein
MGSKWSPVRIVARETHRFTPATLDRLVPPAASLQKRSDNGHPFGVGRGSDARNLAAARVYRIEPLAIKIHAYAVVGPFRVNSSATSALTDSCRPQTDPPPQRPYNFASAASAWASQDVISMARYSPMAADNSFRACSGRPILA